MDWVVIDGIGPFFRHEKSKRINWSKIPFTSFEQSGGLEGDGSRKVVEDFSLLCSNAAAAGYNAVTLDDVAHLYPWAGHGRMLNEKIGRYRQLYKSLFKVASEYGLRILLTTDIMYYTREMEKEFGSRLSSVCAFMRQALRSLFRDFPEIAGIVFRMGESDGEDVRGDFRSRLLIKRPAQARCFLRAILPVFEQSGRSVIFRTWTIGAYRIGDLMWNPATFKMVFAKIDSPALIISMKYGESDFFRYLRTNPLFFVSGHKKIVEFQARREYEGFGFFPSFAGFDCEKHMRELAKAPNLVGASVWCQTGGWGKSRKLTWIRNSSPWVELNCEIMPRIFRGQSCEEALTECARIKYPGASAEALPELLRLADSVMENLLYVREYAGKELFFRRLRLPPTLFVFWDRIMVSADIRNILRCLVNDPQAAVSQARQAVQDICRMRKLALENRLPDDGMEMFRKTGELLLAVREYYFGSEPHAAALKLEVMKERYKQNKGRRYSLMLDFSPALISPASLMRAIPILLRKRARYRPLDRYLLLRGVSILYPLVKRWYSRLIPGFTRKQTMGVDTFFK